MDDTRAQRNAARRAKYVRRGRPSKTPRERFLAKVLEQDGDACWLWTAGTNEMGYGLFNRATRPSQSTLAHRYAFELFVGPIPDGLCVLHRCDNPLCVRPDHLFLGTRTDNANDKVSKGRQRGPKGEAHPKCKLSEAKVREIRDAFAAGETNKSALARRLGIPNRTVHAVINRETWSHI